MSQFALPTVKVRFKESGHECSINKSDFDPEVHEVIRPRLKKDDEKKGDEKKGEEGKSGAADKK